MKSWRNGLSAVCLLSFVATGLWGCGQQALPDRAHDSGGATIQSRNAQLGTERLMNDAQSNGILAANELAQRLNQHPGIQNTTVLVYNGHAYVGLTSIGNERIPDAQIKQDSFRGESPWGTTSNPKSAAGMTVEQLQTEGIRSNAATREGPRSSISGTISDSLKRKVESTVKQSLPHVQKVYVTGNLEVTQRLSGYKHFISRGGDMAPFMNDFLTVLSNSF
ncbi:hypothetical protein CIG75_05295 [Tumebacillus algifaecis]|uniref:Sporulation protein n=1 Tax=Tumebacillus algifaecis TaxID=1214604 RepID=A0A223CYQ1_9BACL|nr:hypothetical protein [Tumebacillus algifaecis]ASS74462.1 hypothetical protein CIG75_05295 [Tumebacillus algifaecis]